MSVQQGAEQFPKLHAVHAVLAQLAGQRDPSAALIGQLGIRLCSLPEALAVVE
jgi:hypothetical protein